MKLLLGLFIVVGCVLGGFVLHHGQLALLFVPTEYLIICGMALGALVAAHPPHVLRGLLREGWVVLRGGAPKHRDYFEALQMLYELLQLSRKEGVLALEAHVEQPYDSPIMGKYRSFLRDHRAVDFLCDTLKLFIASVLEPHDLDELMERDLEVLHKEDLAPARALQGVADSLPAIGIVAAVLGIILTMQAIDQGAAVVGVKVAGALVGTFLGVFLAYGIAGPIAASMSSIADARDRYRQCLRQIVTAGVAGVTPTLAVEIGRRNIFSAERPSFEELEQALRRVRDGG